MSPYRRLRRCVVKDCNFEEKKLYYFPRRAEGTEKWREACGNPELDSIPIDKLRAKAVVCKRHFSWDQFVHPLSERLNRNAVPTLFLPMNEYQDDDDTTISVDPSLVHYTIVPPLESSGFLNFDVGNYPKTCANDSRDQECDLSEEIPSLVSSVLPSTQVLPFKEESETSVLGSTANEMTKPESSVTPIENHSDHTEDGETSVLESTASKMTKPEGLSASVSDYDGYTNDSESSVFVSTADDLIQLESPIAPINDYYRYTLCRLCFSINNFMINIFEEELDCGFMISDTITDLLQFKVSKADDYPQFVCTSCLTKLSEFKEFKDKFCKKKEAFDKELNKYRMSSCEDNGDIIARRGIDSSLIDENVDNSQDVGSKKSLSDDEEILESSSEAEGATSNVEDTAVDIAECETKKKRKLNLTGMGVQTQFRCQECGEVFKCRNLFTEHVKEHQKTLPITCKYCGKRFSSLLLLNKHIITHSDHKPFQCERCGMQCHTETKLFQHKITHSDGEPFFCSSCGINFRSWEYLSDHMKKHSDTDCYKCEECGKEFETCLRLYRHKFSHTKEKPFICGECGKSFRKRCLLNWHMQCIHSDEKFFHCKRCNKSFSLMKYLRNHMKIHHKT